MEIHGHFRIYEAGARRRPRADGPLETGNGMYRRIGTR
jgi:hypothetical protein